ncbi:MAG: hypothetical protein HY909_03560 [Deltaproteobacteria bacterium]|nr:hypothetical protein [Deltaproteobacteria bacterium]
MRHQKHKKSPGRSSAVRGSYVREMIRGLVLNGRVVTTEGKARVVRGEAERVITQVVHVLRGTTDTAARRAEVYRTLNPVLQFHSAPAAPSETGSMVDALVAVCEKHLASTGGYLRLLKYRNRRGDGAPLAVLEWRAALEHLHKTQAPLTAVRSASPASRAETGAAAPASE